MGKPVVQLKVNEQRLQRAIREWAHVLGPAAVETVTRRAALGVVDTTIRGLNGDGVSPKRVDTGRYRAAWGMGLERATGLRPSAPTPVEASPDNAPRATDGVGRTEGKGLKQRVVIRNNVSYGPYVEHGTATMRAGLHLTRALRLERRRMDKALAKRVKASWEGKK